MNIRAGLLGGLLLASAPLMAQNLNKELPKNTPLVISANGKELSENIGLDKLTKLEMFKDADSTLQILFNSEESGIDLKANSHLFVEVVDSALTMGLVVPVTDAKTLEDALEGVFEVSDKVKGKKVFYDKEDEMFLILSKKSLRLVGFMPEKDSYYTARRENKELTYEQWEEQKADRLKVQRDKYIAYSLNKKNLGLKDETFDEVVKEDADLSLWVNVEKGYPQIQAFQANIIQDGYVSRSDRQYLEITTAIQERLLTYYKGSYNATWINFEEDEITLRSKQVSSEKLADLTEGVHTSVDPKLFNYIKGDDLLGVVALALDNKVLFKSTASLYRDLMSAVPEYGEKAVSVFDLLDIVVDEDAIGSLLKGDAILAVNDLREFEMTYTDFEMDENYNFTEVEKTKTEKLPVFTLAVNTSKDIQLVLNALKAFELIKEDKGYYRVENKEVGKLPLYLAFTKDMTLLFTNDEELVKNRLETGYQDLAVSKEQQQAILDNSIYMNFDANAIEETVKENFPLSNKDKEELEQMAVIEHVTLKGKMVSKTVFEYQGNIKLEEQNQSSLLTILEITDKLYRMSNPVMAAEAEDTEQIYIEEESTEEYEMEEAPAVEEEAEPAYED